MGTWIAGVVCKCGREQGFVVNPWTTDNFCLCGTNVSEQFRGQGEDMWLGVKMEEDCMELVNRLDKNQGKELGLTGTSGKEDIMRRSEFNKLVEEVIDEIRARLITKGAEYADSDNVFRNFDNAAKMRGITPIQALEGMLLKHEVSIQDIVTGASPNKRDLVWEKFLDCICYRILEIGLLRRDEQAPF